jgi:hypothetical protein
MHGYTVFATMRQLGARNAKNAAELRGIDKFDN